MYILELNSDDTVKSVWLGNYDEYILQRKVKTELVWLPPTGFFYDVDKTGLIETPGNYVFITGTNLWDGMVIPVSYRASVTVVPVTAAMYPTFMVPPGVNYFAISAAVAQGGAGNTGTAGGSGSRVVQLAYLVQPWDIINVTNYASGPSQTTDNDQPCGNPLIITINNREVLRLNGGTGASVNTYNATVLEDPTYDWNSGGGGRWLGRPKGAVTYDGIQQSTVSPIGDPSGAGSGGLGTTPGGAAQINAVLTNALPTGYAVVDENVPLEERGGFPTRIPADNRVTTISGPGPMGVSLTTSDQHVGVFISWLTAGQGASNTIGFGNEGAKMINLYIRVPPGTNIGGYVGGGGEFNNQNMLSQPSGEDTSLYMTLPGEPPINLVHLQGGTGAADQSGVNASDILGTGGNVINSLQAVPQGQNLQGVVATSPGQGSNVSGYGILTGSTNTQSSVSQIAMDVNGNQMSKVLGWTYLPNQDNPGNGAPGYASIKVMTQTDEDNINQMWNGVLSTRGSTLASVGEIPIFDYRRLTPASFINTAPGNWNYSVTTPGYTTLYSVGWETYLIINGCSSGGAGSNFSNGGSGALLTEPMIIAIPPKARIEVYIGSSGVPNSDPTTDQQSGDCSWIAVNGIVVLKLSGGIGGSAMYSGGISASYGLNHSVVVDRSQPKVVMSAGSGRGGFWMTALTTAPSVTSSDMYVDTSGNLNMVYGGYNTVFLNGILSGGGSSGNAGEPGWFTLELSTTIPGQYSNVPVCDLSDPVVHNPYNDGNQSYVVSSGSCNNAGEYRIPIPSGATLFNIAVAAGSIGASRVPANIEGKYLTTNTLFVVKPGQQIIISVGAGGKFNRDIYYDQGCGSPTTVDLLDVDGVTRYPILGIDGGAGAGDSTGLNHHYYSLTRPRVKNTVVGFTQGNVVYARGTGVSYPMGPRYPGPGAPDANTQAVPGSQNGSDGVVVYNFVKQSVVELFTNVAVDPTTAPLTTFETAIPNYTAPVTLGMSDNYVFTFPPSVVCFQINNLYAAGGYGDGNGDYGGQGAYTTNQPYYSVFPGDTLTLSTNGTTTTLTYTPVLGEVVVIASLGNGGNQSNASGGTVNTLHKTITASPGASGGKSAPTSPKTPSDPVWSSVSPMETALSDGIPSGNTIFNVGVATPSSSNVSSHSLFVGTLYASVPNGVTPVSLLAAQ